MMAVPIITWSNSNGGSAITDSEVDHGSGNNGQTLSASTIYLSHTGTNAITSCGIYITAETGDYDGSFTASDDIDEFLGWGNETTAAGFGGFQLNLNATGSFPTASWPSYSSKDKSTGGNIVGTVCRTGTGDSASNAVSVVTQMGCNTDGEIQTGSAPNVRFQCRVVIPSDEDTAGVRVIRSVLTYSYTS